MNNQYRQPNQNAGFTLIELVITVAIIGIIAAIAAPSMQTQIQQARIKDGANILEAAIKEARTQAVIMQRPTRLVLTNTSADKRATIYFVKKATSDPDEQIANYVLNKDLTITTSPALTAISFSANKKAFQGQNADTADGVLNGKFSVCYGGATVNKYSVAIDANSNINSGKDGSCP
ncbi:MAG: pilus assembly FimT family protein [Moraxella sp.]